jgi:hypothetical protein
MKGINEMGKRAMLQSTLEKGAVLSIEQIVKKFGYTTGNCARKDITRIRDLGVPVGHVINKATKRVKYAIFGSTRPAIETRYA